jgi:CheY-like chemotaxis protein
VATRLIRQQWSAADLPIIAMTAHALPEEREQCRQAGMNAHLTKPVDVEELHRCLLQWVRHTARPGIPPVTNGPRVEPVPGLPACLPGLDLEQGLARLNGNVGLYCRLIISLARDKRHAGREIRSALSEPDLKKAGNLVHALKGVAGNVAANRLYEVLLDLETACQRGDADTARCLQPVLESRLVEIIESAEALKRSLPSTAGRQASKQIDPTELAALLQELGDLSTQHNLKIMQRLPLLAALVAGTEYAPFVSRLTDTVDRLDFASASRQIETMTGMITNFAEVDR